MDQTRYTTIECDTALNHLKRRIPYEWDLNIYRGCAHGCRYCYAMHTHKYLEGGFYQDIYVKTNIVDQLEKELRNPKWRRAIINIGGVTDSYQPGEAEYRLMPEILKLMIRYKNPCIISTKSDLVLRDYDLIDELSRLTYVNVAATITTVDEQVGALLEPGAPSSERRAAMIGEFAKTEASTGIHFMPIVPFITDSEENIDGVLALAARAKAGYVLPGTLYLLGGTKKSFLQFAAEAFPGFYPQLAALYVKGGAGKDYKNGLYEKVNRLTEKHGLNRNYAQIIKEKLGPDPGEGPEQITLF